MLTQQELNVLAKRLDSEAKGKRCLRCRGPVWRAFIDQTWKLRCNCYSAGEPVLGFVETSKIEQSGRLGEMVNEDIKAKGAIIPFKDEVGLAPMRTMTIAEFDERQGLLKHVVGQMLENIHYGIIPGTQDKSLWEAGAEYLRAAFNVQWDYDLVKEVENLETWDLRYEFRVYQLIGPGVRVGGWTGSAWSRERKFYCSRACPRPCPQEHPPRGMEQEMLPHNVKDRALKRAFVAMIRNTTGTTGYFKQALDVDPPDLSGIDRAAGQRGGVRSRVVLSAQDKPLDVGPDGIGAAIRKDFLSRCPEHKTVWEEGKYGKWHRMPRGQPLCSLKKVFATILEEAFAASGEPNDLASFLKLRFKATLSQLSEEQLMEAMKVLVSKAKRPANPDKSGKEEQEDTTPPDDDTREYEPDSGGLFR